MTDHAASSSSSNGSLHKQTATSPTKKRRIFAIVGNIGSGKTTLAENICNLYKEDFSCVLEPVEEWKQSGILDAFYKDMKGRSLDFQMYAFSSRQCFLKRKWLQDERHIVMDGHILSDRHVFKEVLSELGYIDQVGNVVYDRTFDDWQELVPEWKPSVVIYVNTSPSVCLERLKRRARREEVGVTLDYLESLKKKFDKMISTIKCDYKVIVIDGDRAEETLVKSVMNDGDNSMFNIAAQEIAYMPTESYRNTQEAEPRVLTSVNGHADDDNNNRDGTTVAASNVEIKASITEEQYKNIQKICDAMDSKEGTKKAIKMADIYFVKADPVSNGQTPDTTNNTRRKLRFSDREEQAEWIVYDRANTEDPKPSLYSKTCLRSNELLSVITGYDASKSVTKERIVYILNGQTRVHLDVVQGLPGQYLELEVMLRSGQTESEGRVIAVSLLQKFQVGRDQLLAESYSDMV